jgi:hypothetical protein
MKTKLLTITTALIALLVVPAAFAAGENDHDHDKGKPHVHEENVSKGPNGGHVIESKAGFAFAARNLLLAGSH